MKEIGDRSDGIAFTSDGTYAYLANGGSDTVSVIKTSTYAIVEKVRVGSATKGIATSPS